MDIMDFSRRVRKTVISLIRDKNNQELKALFLEKVNSELPDKITDTQITQVIDNIALYYELTKKLFDYDNGFISKFTFDGKFPSQMAMSKSVWKTPSEFVRIMNDSRVVKPSIKAMEDKEEFDKLYERVKSFKSNEHLEVEFPEQLSSKLEELSNLLKEETGEEFREKESYDFESLTALKRSLTEISAVPTEMRVKYYSYWETRERIFSRFTNIIKDIEGTLLSGKSIDNEQLLEVDEGAKKLLGELTEDAILPSYILGFSPIISREYKNSVKSIMLLKNFLTMVGREIPKKYKNLLPNQDITSQMGLAYDYNEQTGNIDISTEANLEDELKDALEELDKQMEDIKIDPLFSILVKNKKVPYAINQDILDNTLELIREELDLTGLNEFKEDIQELLDKEIDVFIENYKETYSVELDKYYLPMMDSSTVISHFNKFESLTITVSYYKNGVLDEKIFTKYSDAVEFVNDNSEKFFKKLIRLLEIEERSSKMLEKPKSMGKEGTPTYFRGGKTIPRPTKTPKVAEEKVEYYKKLLDIVIEYYIEPLSGSMILLEDTPEFYTGKYFRDLPIILTKNPIVLAEKAMLQGVAPIADKNDYNKISELLRTLENPDDVTFNDKLINLFEDALDSYVKFWTLVSVTTEKEEFSLREILTDARIVLGDALYEIAKQTESKEALDTEMFYDEPLSFWNKEQEKKNVSIRGLLPLLGQKEWKTYVVNQNNRERGTKSAYDRLLRMLKESDLKLAGELTNAMLDATDILRKMQGLPVYYSKKDITEIEDLEYVINKIRKEHNIDLYGVDIYNIVKSQSSFNDIGNTFGLSSEIIYKIKGLFR